VLAELDYHETAEADPTLPNVHGRLFVCDSCGVAYPSHLYDLQLFADMYQKNIRRLDLFHRSILQDMRQLLLKEIVKSMSTRFSFSNLLAKISLNAFLVPSFSRGLRGLSVLDVGCGYGDFSKVFRDLGATVTSTEVVPTLVHRLRSDGFECHYGELETIDFGRRRFDLIFMRGVFYRTRDPAAALLAAKGLLAEGGELAVIDPCAEREGGAEYFFRRQFPQGQFYIMDPKLYGSMLERRFGMTMKMGPLIYGRPALLSQGGVWGNLAEFTNIFVGNLLRRRPFMLPYTLLCQ
jgi:SAM-dependent methyltransferase